ncbi:MAG TPA: PAS domain S-box protein [Caulobacteraceae bacterium]|nr:PAS domain S-box protein [Caulobacteraceae bacterium]
MANVELLGALPERRSETNLLAGADARRILDELPAPIYAADAAGRITYYNEAAAQMWGHRPLLGTSEWCGSWKLYWPDGRPLAHSDCPMAMALRERRPIRGIHAVAERPDGTRAPFMANPTPLFDARGRLVGAVDMLVDLTESARAEELAQRLAAIVTNTQVAIVGKNLDGVIESWNGAAEQLFGYSANEAVGQSIMMLIPPDRHDEEAEILARLRRGERVEIYETLRRRKDGSLVDVSLCVSPIRNAAGIVIGASKIARDISERRRADERQLLLLREMNHRIKNLLALASGVVALSARSADTAEELASAVRQRLAALAAAQTLTLPKVDGEIDAQPTSLHALIGAIAQPFEDRPGGAARVRISGDDTPISSAAVTNFALLVHEFATNAAKYGALSTEEGRVEVTCAKQGERFLLQWSETGGPAVELPAEATGFGSVLARMVQRQFDGELDYNWRPEGLAIRFSVARERLSA